MSRQSFPDLLLAAFLGYTQSPLFRLLIVLFTVGLAGCATYQINPPLTQSPLPDPYDFNHLAERNPDLGKTAIILAFSGGGTRKAGGL